MPLVDLCAVHKHYGNNHVLKGVDLRVEAGQVVAIIGRSGSGKSTLLRSINGLEAIDDGQIVVDNAVLQGSQATPARSRVVVKGMKKADANDLARQMLVKVGLAEKFDAYPDQLSGGQQQRVAIARALAMQPKVLLCDEITSALDPELVNEVLAVVKQLAAEGMTLIMVTHEMRFARDVGDQLVFMHQGLIHESGPAKEVFASPKTAELAAFIGAVQ